MLVLIFQSVDPKVLIYAEMFERGLMRVWPKKMKFSLVVRNLLQDRFSNTCLPEMMLKTLTLILVFLMLLHPILGGKVVLFGGKMVDGFRRLVNFGDKFQKSGPTAGNFNVARAGLPLGPLSLIADDVTKI